MIGQLNKQTFRAKKMITVIFYSLLNELCCGRDILENSKQPSLIIYGPFYENLFVDD